MLKKIFKCIVFCFLLKCNCIISAQTNTVNIDNIYSFAKLYGYVRYFYPGDEAASLDWDKFSYYGIQQVEKAKNREELLTILDNLFLPVSPGITINQTNKKRQYDFLLITPSDTSNTKLVAWQDFGFTEKKHYLYAHSRTNRNISGQDSVVRLFHEKPVFGAHVQKEIGNDLTCVIPLTLYSKFGKTYPESSVKELEKLLLKISESTLNVNSADDVYVRLSAIVKCWNVFRHFYPYFNEVKLDWENELSVGIRTCFEINSKDEFTSFLKKWTAKLQDGHLEVYCKAENYERYFPPFKWLWVENKLVISEVYDKNISLKKGDVVVEVNDYPTLKYITENEQHYSSARPEHLRALTLSLLLYQKKDTPVKLKVLNEVESKVVIMKHSLAWADIFPFMEVIQSKQLQDSIYYLNLNYMSKEEFEKILPSLIHAKGIIYDVRHTPKSSIRCITTLLNHEDTSSTWLNVPKVSCPDFENVKYESAGWGLMPDLVRLTAKIVFLTGPNAISYAESVLGFVEHYNLGTIIGEQTAGTNGDVTKFSLPGGYLVRFTGAKVLKHDGSQHHGIGIIPDIKVEQTIDGIKDDLDEVLEKAMKYLQLEIGK